MASTINLKVDIINSATKGRCLLLVEGKDDPKFYKRMANDNNRYKFDVRKVEQYGQGAGCNKIIDMVFEDVDFLDKNGRRFLAIIDGDAKEYRGISEKLSYIKDKSYVYLLDYYSFESYCFDKKSLCKILSKITSATEEEVENNILDVSYEYILDKIQTELYYIGLDCLYTNNKEVSIFKYSDDGVINIKGKREHNFKGIDKDKLDCLALEYGITNELYKIRKLVKGKHFLMFCACNINLILSEINKNRLCKSDSKSLISKKLGDAFSEIACDSESLCTKKECVFDIDINGVSAGNEKFTYIIYNDLKNNLDSEELDIIKTKIDNFIENQ